MLRTLFGPCLAFPLLAATALAQCPSWLPAGVPGQNPFVFARFDDGSGPAVYASDAASLLRRWNGTSWSSVPSSPVGGSDLAVGGLGFGGPERLYSISIYSTVDSFDGTTTTNLPGVGNLFPWPPVIAVLDDGLGAGNAVFVGGQMSVNGGPYSAHVARWNGTSWAELGGAIASVRAFESFDDGTGRRLYAGGGFTQAGEIARWSGSSWESLPGPRLEGTVTNLRVHDDGAGPALYACGEFTLPVSARVVKWSGSQWTAVGAAFNSSVSRLASFDDGSGPALYATGLFTSVGAVPVAHIARWNGTAWSALGAGLDGTAQALLPATDRASGAPELFVAGNFLNAGGSPAPHVARWRGCSFDVFCAGDGADPAVVACPCGNFGGAGRGCANSVNANGAQLAASGLPVVAQDTLTLATNGVTGSFALFFQGDAFEGNGTGALLGDGVRCVGGSLRRLGTRAASGGVATHGFASGSSIASIGLVSAAGGVEYYQAWYRNAASYCTSDTFNLTNGVRVLWVP